MVIPRAANIVVDRKKARWQQARGACFLVRTRVYEDANERGEEERERESARKRAPVVTLDGQDLTKKKKSVFVKKECFGCCVVLCNFKGGLGRWVFWCCVLREAFGWVSLESS
jgi:hypothetical protein